MLAKSVHSPMIADEDNLEVQAISHVRRGFVYHYWRFPRLYNVYGDIVRVAQGHNLGLTAPGGGIPNGRAVHLELALGHHPL